MSHENVIPLIEKMVSSGIIESLLAPFRMLDRRLNVILRNSLHQEICTFGCAQQCVALEVAARLGNPCSCYELCWRLLRPWTEEVFTGVIIGNWDRHVCRGAAWHLAFRICAFGYPIGELLIGPFLKESEKQDECAQVRSTVPDAVKAGEKENQRVNLLIAETLAERVHLLDAEIEALIVQGLIAAKTLSSKFEEAASRTGVWVAMPFGSEFNDTYDHGISVALRKMGYEPIRVDRVQPSGSIMQAIKEGILNSTFVVADVSGGNPNVLYEVAFADANAKCVLFITDKEPVPFCLRDRQYATYQRGKTATVVGSIEEWVMNHQCKGEIPRPGWFQVV